MSQSGSILEDELTICSGLFAAGIIIHFIRDKWRKCKENALAVEESRRGDSYHKVRYRNAFSQQKLVVHTGSCHCSKVQFKILAPRRLYAVDIPSKIRFPRVTVYYHDFELMNTDISVLSTYTVRSTESNTIGIHSFCSYCGMQVLFAPTLDPVEVHVNLDCLETGTIEEVHIAYHTATETSPIQTKADEDSRGLGYNPHSAKTVFPELLSGPTVMGSRHIASTPRDHPSSEAPTEILFSSPLHVPSVISTSPKGHNKSSYSYLDNDSDSLSISSLESVDPRGVYERPCPTDSLWSDEDSLSLSSCSRRSSYDGRSTRSDLIPSVETSPASTKSSSLRKSYVQVHNSAVDYNSYERMKKYLCRHLDGKSQKKSKAQIPLNDKISESTTASM